MEPSQLEDLVFLNLCASQHSTVMDIAEQVKKDPVCSRFCTTTLYLLILELLAASKDSPNSFLALKLFQELHTKKVLIQESRAAANALFSCLQHCKDFTVLLPLKMVQEGLIVTRLPETEYEVKYIGATLNILLNTDQLLSAVQTYENAVSLFTSVAERNLLFDLLPIQRLHDAMLHLRDCSNLARLLHAHRERRREIPVKFWSEALSLGIALNDYDLVKVIYSDVIMDGIGDELSLDDVLFKNKVQRLQGQSMIFASLSNTALSGILRTLASHGDVRLVVNLIEWHHIHKTMKGESALTKSLCLDIIQSYCYHQEDSREPPNKSEEDTSVQRVIDVLESFVSKQQQTFTYTDVSESFSRRFNAYRHYDQNVADASAKQSAIAEDIILNQHPEDEGEGTPLKITRKDPFSPSGSVLKNRDILRQFICSHVEYILKNNYHATTLHLFVASVLHHVQKYQNASGVVAVLAALRTVNDNFVDQWLTSQLLDIITFSLSNSPASSITGYKLYGYLKDGGCKFTLSNMENFINSSLRGPKFNSLLEFYSYETLKLGFKVRDLVIQRIKSFSHLNRQGELLLEILEGDITSNEVEKLWDEHGFTRNVENLENMYEDNYSHYLEMDLRDAGYVDMAFGEQMASSSGMASKLSGC